MIFEVKNYATLKVAIDSLCEFLTANDVPKDCVFDSRLVACELLSNVLRHADGQAGLRGEIKDGYVELKILTKRVFTPETITCAELYSEHGRGLFLVNTLCEEQIFSEEDGVRVLIRIRESE